MPEQIQIPRILWAQQREHILLTIAVPDIEKVDVKFEEDSVSFQGQSTTSNAKDKNVYAVKINLYEKIDPETSKYENIGQKFWRLLLKKKDNKGAFWPRLTKDKTRLHWLQTDFDHWKDEDESDDEKAGGFNGNFQDMFSGGMPGMGMGGMPGMGMGGMPGMGMGGMPGMDMGDGSDEEDDLDDEEGSPMGGEHGADAQKEQESKRSTDGSASKATAGEQESASKQQSA
jgi:prostaglandin-E synthase